MSLSGSYVPGYFLKNGNHMSLSAKSAEFDRDVLGFHQGLAVFEMDAENDAARNPIDKDSSKLYGKHVILKNAKNLPRKVIIINSKNVEIPLSQCTALKPIKVGQEMLRRALEFSKESLANKSLKDYSYQPGSDKSLSNDKKTPAELPGDKTGIACTDFQEFEAKFYREIVSRDSVLSRFINHNKRNAETTQSAAESEFVQVPGKPLKVYARRRNTPSSPEHGDGGSPEVNASESRSVVGKGRSGHVMGKIKHFKDKNNQESHHGAAATINTIPSAAVSDGGSEAFTSGAKRKLKKRKTSKALRASKKRMFIRREIERCLSQRKRPKKSAEIRTASTQTTQETSTNSTQTDRSSFSEDEPYINDLLNGDDYFITDNGADANFGQGPTIVPIKRIDVKSQGDMLDISGGNLPLTSYKFDNFGVDNQLEQEKILFFQCLNNCTEIKTMGNLNIHLAVSQNDVAEVQRQCIALRVRQMSIDPLNDNGMTPLHLAVINDCVPQIVRLLLKFGADIALTDQDGNNPLHLAVMSGADSILGMLLSVVQQKNFKVDMFNFEGFTPLMLATLENNYLITELLLDSNANPNLRDLKSGRTPLFHAVENSNTELVRLLLKYKANTRISNFFGTSTHEAIFELDNINQEIKSMVIGKDAYQIRNRTSEKKRRAPANKEKPESAAPTAGVKKPKLKIVKLLKKVT